MLQAPVFIPNTQRARFVPASGWVAMGISEEDKTDLLRSGIVPENDRVLPLFSGNYAITLLFGGRGGGKSESVADRLIDDCINEPYFKCYYGRKVFTVVRDSCFATLVHSIKKRGLRSEFNFSEADNSTMIITHRPSGNKLIPFGADKADNLKSIKDPTDVWCEEFDQFTAKDFEDILPTLRTQRGYNRFYGTFNTEPVRPTHWIIKAFFPEKYSGTDGANMEVLDEVSVQKIFINFPDNYFLDQTAYRAAMLLAAGGDWVKYNAIAEGQWGTDSTKGAFWKQFNPAKHVVPTPYVPAPVHVSLDDNVNPYLPASVWQITGRCFRQIHEIAAKEPDNTAPKAARLLDKYLRKIGHTDKVFVYGDTTAQKRSTIDADSLSFFQVFIKEMEALGWRCASRVGKGNPRVALSGDFVNEILEGQNAQGWTVQIDPSNKTSIDDYQSVKEDPEGGMLKQEVTDPATKRKYQPYGHFSDAFRYFIIQVLTDDFARWIGRKRSPIRHFGGL